MIYYHKEPASYSTGGSGDGSEQSPWYWYTKTDGKSVSMTMTAPVLYLRVKLQGGTTYNIGQYDYYYFMYQGRLSLYSQSGTRIAYNDYVDPYDPQTGDYKQPEVDGNPVTQMLTYTPSQDTVVIIASGLNTDYYSPQYWQYYQNNPYNVYIDNAPLTQIIPSPVTVYPPSTGFNTLGKSIGYRSAGAADISIFSYMNKSLVFYAPFDRYKNYAQTGQTLTYNSSLVSFTTADGIPCALGEQNGSWHVSVDSSALPMGAAPCTMSMWLKLSAAWSNSNRDGMMAYGPQGSGNYRQLGVGRYSGDFVYYIGYTSGSQVLYTNPTSWHHLCAVFTGTTVTLYLDGVLGPTVSYNVNTTSGDLIFLTNRYSPAYFAAARIYDRALKDYQIAILASQLSPVVQS